MGLLHKDLEDRTEVYDEFIKHLKDKIHADSIKNTIQNEWIMETYDNEVKKADRGDAYMAEKLIALGFGGLATGLLAGAISLGEPSIGFALSGGALASTAISLQNYIKFKRLTLGRSLGTRMFYAETLQNIVEENGFKFPFNSGSFDDYEHVEEYMKVIKKLENNGMDRN